MKITIKTNSGHLTRDVEVVHEGYKMSGRVGSIQFEWDPYAQEFPIVSGPLFYHVDLEQKLAKLFICKYIAMNFNKEVVE